MKRVIGIFLISMCIFSIPNLLYLSSDFVNTSISPINASKTYSLNNEINRILEINETDYIAYDLQVNKIDDVLSIEINKNTTMDNLKVIICNSSEFTNFTLGHSYTDIWTQRVIDYIDKEITFSEIGVYYVILENDQNIGIARAEVTIILNLVELVPINFTLEDLKSKDFSYHLDNFKLLKLDLNLTGEIRIEIKQERRTLDSWDVSGEFKISIGSATDDVYKIVFTNRGLISGGDEIIINGYFLITKDGIGSADTVYSISAFNPGWEERALQAILVFFVLFTLYFGIKKVRRKKPAKSERKPIRYKVVPIEEPSPDYLTESEELELERIKLLKKQAETELLKQQVHAEILASKRAKIPEISDESGLADSTPQKFCSKCGARLIPSDPYCTECGQRVASLQESDELDSSSDDDIQYI